MLELLSPFLPLAGGAGLSSPAAKAGASGEAAVATANKASSNSLIETFFMQLSDCIVRRGSRPARSYTCSPPQEHLLCPKIPDARAPREYDQRFMQMNEIRHAASDRVQCAMPNVADMIDGTDHPAPPDHPTL